MATSACSSPSAWAERNTKAMLKAKALTREMLKQVRDNEDSERASKDAAMEQTEREKQNKRDEVFAKAVAHGDVIGTSSKCMRDIEDATLQTDNSLSLLRQERALAFASLQVCNRRIMLRERRPEAEVIQDAVHHALESELKMLEKAREDFLQLEEDGRKIAEDLRRTRAHLSQDTGERRLNMKHDQQSLKPHVSHPIQGVEQRQPPSISEDESRKMLDRTFRLLARSSRHRQKTSDLVKRVKEDSKVAVFKTEECLEKRTDELVVLGKELTQHMKDAEAAISVAERSLDKSDKRLDPDDSKKREKLANDRAILEKLRQHKEELHREIENKFKALDIDNRCRRVTPVKACEHTPEQLNALVPSNSAPGLLATSAQNNMNQKMIPFGGSKSFSSSGGDSGVQGKKYNVSPSLRNSATAQMGGMKAKR